MSAETEPVVLGRIHSAAYYHRPPSYRREVDEWLEANGIEPRNILVAGGDVVVQLMDAPCIARREIQRDDNGKPIRHPDDPGWLLTKPVVSVLRAPLPDHLNDATTTGVTQ